MKRKSEIPAWSVCCVALLAFAPVSQARVFPVTVDQCGTAVLTPQPSENMNEKVFGLVETGTTRALGTASSSPTIAALSNMTYVCQGMLVKYTYKQTSGEDILFKLAFASCTFNDGTPDYIHAQAISMGRGTSSAPPKPPVSLEVLHGTGKFRGIKGKGRGAGSLPISENSAQECALVKWRFHVPDQSHRE